MKHRIRAAGIVIKNNRILLVKHIHPDTGFAWWVPPGGGVEGSDTSILDCIVREVFEETGLTVRVDDTPLFVREFADTENDTLNLEIFFGAEFADGELTIENIRGKGGDEHYIKEVRWFSVEEMAGEIVFPEELKNDFGRSLEKVYLGRQTG